MFGYTLNNPTNFNDPWGTQRADRDRPGDFYPGMSEPYKSGKADIPTSSAFDNLFGDGGIFTRQTFSEFLSATERSKRHCKSTWTQRFKNNAYETNAALPGRFAPSIFPGVGLGALTAGATAKTFGGMTTFQWASNGFRGAIVGADTFTVAETAMTVGATTAVNFVLVSGAYELGVGIGSALNATFGFSDYCPCGN